MFPSLKGRETRATQLEYRDGKLATRDYVNPAGRRLSREVFARDGYIVETVTYDPDTDAAKDHWWFERGQPVRQVKAGVEFGRRGDRWVAQGTRTEPTSRKKERAAPPAVK